MKYANLCNTAEDFNIDCKHPDVQVVHHTDEYGLHWCPTGLVMCYDCLACGDELEPNECERWGE